ncbi:MAG: hypothetical protein D6695_07175, partial [Planctomycetota bacterium]
ADICRATGTIVQIRAPGHEQGVLARPIGQMRMIVNGREWQPGSPVRMEVKAGSVCFWFPVGDEQAGLAQHVLVRVSLPVDAEAVDLSISRVQGFPRPDGGLNAALRMPIEPGFLPARLRTDSPFAAHVVEGGEAVCRKYPQGDWMTSPQWFEHLRGAICSSTFIDLADGNGCGFAVLHDSTQQWIRTERGVEAVLMAYDPWDERRFAPDDQIRFRIVPHTGMSDAARVRLACAFLDDTAVEINKHPEPVGGGGAPEDNPIPPVFSPIEVLGDDNIVCHALYRDSIKSGEHLPDWAGHEMAERSDGACTHPFIVRLVEWDAEPGTAILKFPGAIAAAAKTNLMGEVGAHVGGGEDTGWLEPEPCEPPEWALGLEIPGGWNQILVSMKPREIATVMLDLVLGRKRWRDLDAKREVWATIHRTSAKRDTNE